MTKAASVDHEDDVVVESVGDDVPDVDVEQYRIDDMAAYARQIAHGDTVVVFDTTLRDGEQSPGATLNIQEKLEIAHQLARLGVDIMEAGFPAASPGDLEAVRKVANTVGRHPRRDDLLLHPHHRPYCGRIAGRGYHAQPGVGGHSCAHWHRAGQRGYSFACPAKKGMIWRL